MIELDESFGSLEDWLTWAVAHPSVFDSRHATACAERIIASGFIEPMVSRRVTPAEIDGTLENWREGIVANGLNSRLRAVLSIVAEKIDHLPSHDVRIFATEAVTPFALLLRGAYPRFLGAEYVADPKRREDLFPIPHQDLLSLDLPSGRFDVVTTNEVLEHVSDLDQALSEIARVLKPGGWHVGTHPFWFMSTVGDVRTRLVDGTIRHIKEPEYHGDPINPGQGSLVFETPGWNILERARAAGFSKVEMRFVASESRGFVTENTGVFVFCARV